MQHRIEHLSKEEWQDKELPAGCSLEMLEEERWKDSCVWGVIDGDNLATAMATCGEEEKNRLRIVELWVGMRYRNCGLGHHLIEIAKEQALFERKEAVVVAPDYCNVNAIKFYRGEGFEFLDPNSEDYERERAEFGIQLLWKPEQKPKLGRDEIQIREETALDYYAVEEMVQRAFWNKFKKGCDEHLLLHKLRKAGEYLSELSRVAVKDGKIIGGIFYSKAYVQDGDKKQEVLCFGPLAVSKEWRNCGVGRMLIEETMDLARKAGYVGIVIFGDPGYYKRFGFKPCEQFGITTKDGKNFDAFMAAELTEGSLGEIRGKFYEASVFESVTPEEADEYNSKFPELVKQYFPTQW